MARRLRFLPTRCYLTATVRFLVLSAALLVASFPGRTWATVADTAEGEPAAKIAGEFALIAGNLVLGIANASPDVGNDHVMALGIVGSLFGAGSMSYGLASGSTMGAIITVSGFFALVTSAVSLKRGASPEGKTVSIDLGGIQEPFVVLSVKF